MQTDHTSSERLIDKQATPPHNFLTLSLSYKMMYLCWAPEPKDRPSFTRLVAFMEHQLSDAEEQVFKSLIQFTFSVNVSSPLTTLMGSICSCSSTIISKESKTLTPCTRMLR